MGVTVTPGPEWSASQPHVVHEGRFLRGSNGNTSWSIAKDGTRLLRIQLVEPERAPRKVDQIYDAAAHGL